MKYLNLKICLLTKIVMFSLLWITQNPFRVSAQIKGNTYRAFYEYSYVMDSLDQKYVQSENMILRCDGSNSIFESENKYLLDSTLYVNRNLPVSERMTFLGMHKTSFNYKIYKDYAANSIRFVEPIIRNTFNFPASNNEFAWQVINEHKKIGALNCQKATGNYCGREYEAWFAAGIPISDGPYVFCGLPGLIIELSDSKKQHVFTMYKLKNAEVADLQISFPQNTIETTKAKFKELKKESGDNIFQQLAGMIDDFKLTSNGKTLTPKEMDRAGKAERDKNNNPIELCND